MHNKPQFNGSCVTKRFVLKIIPKKRRNNDKLDLYIQTLITFTDSKRKLILCNYPKFYFLSRNKLSNVHTFSLKSVPRLRFIRTRFFLYFHPIDICLRSNFMLATLQRIVKFLNSVAILC